MSLGGNELSQVFAKRFANRVRNSAVISTSIACVALNRLTGLPSALFNDLPGHYGMVEQATGVPKAKGQEAFEWLRDWIEEVKENGLVESLINDFGVHGNLLVAPAAKL